MKSFKVETAGEPTDQERETIAALVNYPSLERAFAENVAGGAEQIKRKMAQSVADFERVVRRGAQAEAEKAARILTAYKTTVAFLEELEAMQKKQAE